ncbi:VID27 cytoplasmic protein-domain-containing protein [Schizophyllum amplum]|uniref:VID27 cytoplasmic protein-domain-containing protein n=1 Tax=Schizophyllum amplum TaxID=97359 RepID=A0A550CSI9_9AGAR|nr:VID27 cytoplasmic protein-domain-containing protein [Auriculariopsis ampla]
MNIFRSLIGKVWQDPNAEEVVKISSGQLYLLRPDQQIRTARECIYNEAIATIRRVPSVEHNFQLVVTRVYEEGDEELLEDEDETDEERVFLIGEELDFYTSENDGDPTFVWRDLQGDPDEFFEFTAPGCNEPTRAFFETCMYRAMYERKYRQSADNLPDSALEEFIRGPPQTQKKHKKSASKKKAVPASTSKQTAPAPVDETAELEAAMDSLKVDEHPKSPPAVKGKAVEHESSAAVLDNMNELVSAEAELYHWDWDKEEFDNQGIVTARILQPKSGIYVFYLAAEVNGRLLLQHQIKTEMNQRWSPTMSSLTWNNIPEHGNATSWLYRFPTEDSFAAFQEKFMKALWETVYQAPWEKMKVDEQQYVLHSNDDIDMVDVQDEEEDEYEVGAALDPDQEASDESETEEEEEEEESGPSMTGRDRNEQLTVGYKGDKAFIVRGKNIGIFVESQDGRNIKYRHTSQVKTPKGAEFKPRQIMLHNQDAQIIISNPTEPNKLYSMDVERGQIVDEWKIHDDIEVGNIAPDNKFAGATHESTFVGASHNALFRVDPRVSGNKLVDSQFKQYVSKNKFSGVTTTASGKLAVASEKGDIRLFDTIGKNAKTALPPLGDPIVGIDVTADGRWIVATTKTYLLLIDTLIGEGRYAGQLGFDRSFPATAKPIPRRLQLRPEHVAYMNSDVNFSPAKFNVGEGQEENAIVTSTGQFVIAWDFKKVKKGNLNQYEIKKFEDHVVQDNFRFGDDKEIIVALANNIVQTNKKNLKRPTRQSLAPPGAGSYNSIVNTPY